MKKLLPALLVLLNAFYLFGQTSIDSTGILPIGGIRQAVSVKGKDNSNPLLLFLHGGPGNSVMHYAQKFTGALQDHFVVVQWDQRNVGRTLALNRSPEPLTAGLFENDTHEIIEVLLKKFHQPKLYLVGHSWGTYLGFYIAINYPELLYAYIPIAPMVNQLESERIALELMKEKALKNGNKQALAELGAVKIPFENAEQLYFDRKWVLDYMGSKGKITKEQVLSWSSPWLAIFNEASKKNLIASAPKLNCPVYFFLGKKDIQTNSKIAEEYFKMLVAPKKELFWFERSGHSLPTTEPDKLQEIIIGLKNK